MRLLHAPLRSASIVGVYTLVWLILDKFSAAFETAPEITLFYPPPALDFLLCFVFGWRYAPALLLPRLLDVWVVPPINLSFVCGGVYALLAAIVYGGAIGLLMQRWQIEPRLRRFRDVCAFVLVATLVAPLLLAVSAVTLFIALGEMAWADWGTRMLYFWVGDSIGVATLAPFLLVQVVPWVEDRIQRREPLIEPIDDRPFCNRFNRWILLERMAEALFLAVATWIAFGVQLRGGSLLYVCFLPMIWLTVRYGLRASTLAVLVINGGAALMMLFQSLPIGTHLTISQFCMLAVSQTALLLGATITRRHEAFLQIQVQAQREQLLAQVARLLNSTLNPHGVLKEIVQLTGREFEVDRVVVWRLGNQRVIAIEEWRKFPHLLEILGREWSIAHWFAQGNLDGDSWRHEPFQARNYAALPHAPSDTALIQQAQILSILRVPIFVRDQFFGNLSLHTTRAYRTFTIEEVRWLEEIAEQIALALFNAQSFEQLEHLVKERTQELEQEKLISESANRAKTDFLANMSHELRTPLTSIQGFSSVLLEEIFGSLNDRQHHYIASIHASGEHLLALINDILDLTRIEAEKEDLTLESIALEAICQASLELLSERAVRQGLQLHLETAPDLPTVQADYRRLHQILVNLLSNAVKFTEQGAVTLRVNSTENWVEFAVMDTGIGISGADQAILFQPFQQLDSGLNRRYEGTGLGLALSQRLAQMHGGEITLQSQPGQGSCFTLRLPLHRSGAS